MQDKLSSFLRTRWVLLLGLIAFVCFKIPQLNFPFYCDEAWVYAPAVKTMALNGPSLMPGSIPDSYSRGHPLFFHFLGAIWIRCFGHSNIAVHAFPLFLSVVFLIALYECCLRLFGKRVAILALLLVGTDVLFFVQSSFLLPEVLVTMLAFLSLYFYSRDHLLFTGLMLAMLFFTKEGGLVFGAVMGIDAIVSFFRRKETLQRRVMRLAAVGIPVLLIGLFFLRQKAVLGWYLFPEHALLIHTDWNTFYKMFQVCLTWTFCGDKACYYLIFFIILLSLTPAVKHRDLRYLFLCLPSAVVYIFSNQYIIEHTGDVIWMVLFVLFFAVPFYCVLQLSQGLSIQSRRFLVLAGICFAAYLFYSSLSQPAYRYLLVAIILALVFLAVSINLFVTAAGSYLFYVAAVGIILIGAYGFYSDEGNTDADIESYHAMKVEQNAISYLEKEQAYDKEIAIGCFWALGQFNDTLQGFLSSNRIFSKIKHVDAGPTTDYAIFDNICSGYGYDNMVKNPGFHLAYKTREGQSWTEIYKRN